VADLADGDAGWPVSAVGIGTGCCAALERYYDCRRAYYSSLGNACGNGGGGGDNVARGGVADEVVEPPVWYGCRCREHGPVGKVVDGSTWGVEADRVHLRRIAAGYVELDRSGECDQVKGSCVSSVLGPTTTSDHTQLGGRDVTLRDGVDTGGVGNGCQVEEVKDSLGEEVSSTNQKDKVCYGPRGGVSKQPRGKNYERNVMNRKRKSFRVKTSGQSGVKTVPLVSVDGKVPRSSFPLVSEKVRAELQETHAKRLIAENQAAELHASRFVSRNDETEGLVRQMIARMELEKKVAKLASTSKIGNWAKTVVGGHASTINSPALSKVPSLESVGLGSSVSSDESVRRDTRMALYNENKRLLEQNLEAQPYLLPDQVEDAYKALVGEFADVLFTPEENAKRKIADMVQDEYASFGMNFSGAKLLVDRLNEGISYEML